MAKVRVTQIKSKNGASQKQIACLQSLGIRRIRHSVELELTPVYKGLIEKVLTLQSV